jgi:type I restriction enzyme S subunit
MDGDFHMCKWANKEAYLNQRVVRFRPKNGISKYFLFLALQEPIHYYNQIIVGTTVAHLGDSHLKSIRILVPDKKFLEKVKEALDPIYELEISLRQKNVNLRQTRDLLLPRLVSGEVDVSSLS